jgi:nitroreductase
MDMVMRVTTNYNEVTKQMDKQEILEAYHFRHACKAFDPSRKITPEDFQFILETGRLSPSSFGLEPWKFVVLQNADIREKLLPITWGGQKSIPTASHMILMLARTKSSMQPDSDYVNHLLEQTRKMPSDIIKIVKQRIQTFFDTDFNLIDNDRALFEWVCRQTYIPLANMMTAAAQIGIDSCPIEGFQKENVEVLLAEEGILDRDQFGLSCMVTFGYRVTDPRAKTRRSLDEVVTWVE